MSADTSWFVGDGVITRYVDGYKVTVRPEVPEPGVHRYRATLYTRPENVEKVTGTRPDLIAALQLGEDWAP